MIFPKLIIWKKGPVPKGLPIGEQYLLWCEIGGEPFYLIGERYCGDFLDTEGPTDGSEPHVKAYAKL